MTSRRRAAAGLTALVAITAALVFGGTLAAQAADGLEFTTTNITYTGGPVSIQGTATGANTGPIDVNFTDPPSDLLCTSFYGAAWACNASLPIGTHDITASQNADLGTPRSASITLTIGLPTPTVSAPATVLEGGTIELEGGNGAAGATIVAVVTTPNEPGLTCSTGVLVADGAWGCDIPFDAELAPDSTATITVTQTHPDASPTSTTWDVFIDDGLSITGPFNPEYGEVVTITGTKNPEVVDVTVRSGPTLADPVVCVVPAAAGTTWSCDHTFPEPGAVTLGAWQGTRTTTEGVGVGTFPAVQMDNPDPYEVPNGEFGFFSGTVDFAGSPSSYVRVDIPALAVACSSPIVGLTWSCDIDLPDFDAQPGETYSYNVQQEDLHATAMTPATFELYYGNPLPGVLQVVSPAEGSSVEWAPAITISGTAPATTPDVSLDIDGVPVTACALLPVDVDGNWSCDVEVAVGSHSVVAHQGATTSPMGGFIVTYPAPSVSTPVTNAGVIIDDGVAPYAGVATYPGVTAHVTTSPFFASCDVTTPLAAGDPWDCGLSTENAAPGSYDVIVSQRVGGTPVGDTWLGTITLTEGLQITSPAEGDSVEWTASGLVISGVTSSTDPVTVYIDGEFEACTDPTPGPTWSCTDPDLEPGSYTLTAQQYLETDHTVAFDLLLPVPDVDQSSYSYPAGTALATFSGGSTYPGADVFVILELGDGVTEECTDTSDATGWSCTIPIGTVPPDDYNLFVYQEIFEGPTSYSLTLPFEVTEVVPVTPTLNCSFRPNGGYSATGAQSLDNLTVSRIVSYGGGSGGGGGGTDEFGQQGYCGGNDGLPFTPEATFDYVPVAGCSVGGCTLNGLAPGDYEAYYTVSDGLPGYDYEPHSYLFRVPSAPTITTAASTTNSVILSGTGTAGDALRVERENGTALCTTTVTGAGTWACQFPKSSTASARVIDIDAQSGGMSAYSAYRGIPVFEPQTPVVPPVDPPITLVSWFLEFGGDLMGLRPGDSFTLNVSGMPEGTEIEVWMHSTPRLLGTATGTGLPMALELTVPEDIENGPHEIEMIGVTPLGTQYFFTSDAMVTGGADPAATPDEEPTEPGDEGGSGGGPVDRTDAAAPSALSESIPPLERIVANPVTVAIAGGLALALLFLVALPTELLNSSLSSNTSRLGRVYGSIDGAMSKAQDWFIRVTRSRALAAGLITVIVAIVYGFIDPGFGFDVVSLRLVLSLALAFFILSYGASWLSGFVIRRLWGTSAVIAIQPSIILFAIVGVVVARILDFSPGFLIGIAIGLELISASRRVSARAVLVQFLFVVGLSLAAWVAYSLFNPGDDFGGMLVEDTLVAVTAEGLTGALIAVFPLQFMDGRELWLDSKRLWVGAFLLVAVPFSLLVLPTAVEGTDVGDYGIWLLVFAVFGLISVAIWLVFARAAKREEERVAAEESVDA